MEVGGGRLEVGYAVSLRVARQVRRGDGPLADGDVLALLGDLDAGKGVLLEAGAAAAAVARFGGAEGPVAGFAGLERVRAGGAGGSEVGAEGAAGGVWGAGRQDGCRDRDDDGPAGRRPCRAW